MWLQLFKSTVSQLCVALDARLDAWRNRSLHETKYPFLIVDALVVKVRRDGAVRPTGVLIVYGINDVREPLDLLVANSESESSWSEIFKRLKHRGLNGLEFLVSNDHAGLVNAVKSAVSRRNMAVVSNALYAQYFGPQSSSFETHWNVGLIKTRVSMCQ